ncbi:hypothetical protein HG530_002845 [Fusarium avenaceum]|nr:hypothetical protein HG530_002845 [Fusarium avenaceum]
MLDLLSNNVDSVTQSSDPCATILDASLERLNVVLVLFELPHGCNLGRDIVLDLASILFESTMYALRLLRQFLKRGNSRLECAHLLKNGVAMSYSTCEDVLAWSS